jgi:EAL domain-containing protein (putative c-di-GMP-specific phosphodiesterase class I)/AmiR/NasT family two-component response regulator
MSRLLIIDDERAFGEFVAKVARQAGFEASATDNAVDFRRRLDEAVPSVVVMDLQMPGVDGLELLHELGERRCRARIVLVSGEDPRVLDAARRLGNELGLSMATPIQKPVRAAALTEVLAGLARQPGELTAADLSQAMADDRLFLLYQPKVDVTSGRLVGVEALVRLKAEDGLVVPPDEFIPLAETSGLIDRLTERVIDYAFPQAAAWRAEGLDLQVAVNLSARNIHDRQLPDILAGKCAASGTPPQSITLELTETAVSSDGVTLLEVLGRFRLKGFHLSIDDFGIGYSSIAQLLRLPFTELKVDQSFVTDMDRVRDSKVVVKTIIDMAHNLGLSAVAEGVETEAVMRLLAEFGCDVAQGYLFSKPVDAARIQSLATSSLGG